MPRQPEYVTKKEFQLHIKKYEKLIIKTAKKLTKINERLEKRLQKLLKKA